MWSNAERQWTTLRQMHQGGSLLCKLLNSVSQIVRMIRVHCAHNWFEFEPTRCSSAFEHSPNIVQLDLVKSQISQGRIMGSTVVADYFSYWKYVWRNRQMCEWMDACVGVALGCAEAVKKVYRNRNIGGTCAGGMNHTCQDAFLSELFFIFWARWSLGKVFFSPLM